MNYTADGLPYIDLRGTTPREALCRVEAFLDEIHADVLRTYAASLIRANYDCADIADHIARKRCTLLAAKLARLGAVVGMLEDLRRTMDGTGGTTP